MKKQKNCATLVAVLFLLVCVSHAQAAINFNFDYSDASNGSLWTTDRMTSLERAATVVEDLFTNYTASIEIQIKSENDAMSTTLASAASNDFVPTFTAGFSNSDVVMNEILTGSDANGAGFDGVVTVNWANPWSTSATAAGVSSSEFDFDSTMSHELLHAVGFLSTISQTGTDGFGNGAGTAGDWSPFDQYVGDSSGLLINQTAFDINQSGYAASLVGGAGTAGLDFQGPNAMAANGGNPVFLFTPTTYETGSSGSHLDDQFAPYMFMMEASTTMGPGIRGIHPIEVAILRDIGYTQIGSIPEPSCLMLLVMGMSAVAASGIRKQS